MRATLRIVMSVVGVMMMCGGRAEAQSAAPPVAATETRGQLGASINNAGLQQSFDWTWRRPVSSSHSLLLSEAHLAAGATAAVTPAALRGGIWVEYAPVSFLVVRAGVDPSQYFGTFDSLTSFDTRDEAFDSDARKARASAASGRAVKWYVSSALQFQVGRIAAQSSLDLEHWASSVAGPLFYEPTRDTLLAVDGDHLATLNTVVLYRHEQASGGQFSVGPVHSLTRVHSSDVNQIQRVGAVIMEQTAGRHLGLIRPKATLLVARYLDDSSKRGEWTAAVAIGFSVSRR